MWAPVLRRAASAVLVLLVVSLFAFLVPQLTGIDPAQAVLRARSPEGSPGPEVVERLRVELGLDRNPAVRYGLWLGRLVQGDLGYSFVSRRPVGPELGRALAASGSLVGLSLGTAIVLGVLCGTLAGARRGSLLDRLVAASSQVGVAVPAYVVAPVLILVFAVGLDVLPASGWRSPEDHVLPVVTLALSAVAFCTQLVRAEVVDELARPYVAAARAKGLRPRRVLAFHVLPNALTSLISVMSLWVPGLLGGAVVVEVIFAVPGLGRALYDGVRSGDVPVIQGGLVLVVAVALATSLLAEILQAMLTPGGERRP